MFKYKVSIIAIAMVDWNSLQSELFSGATTSWAEFGGQVGVFHFETQPVVADLGKLIKVEAIQ